MDKKALLKIRTAFWCHSILQELQLNSLAGLLKLENLSEREFLRNHSSCFTNRDTAIAAHIILCVERFEPKTWRKYFKGETQPTTIIKDQLNAVDLIGSVLPKTKLAFQNGPFNILKVFTAGYNKEAVISFAEGVEELYRTNNLQPSVWQMNVFTKKYELHLEFKKDYYEYLAKGQVMAFFSCYREILDTTLVELDSNKSILQLTEAFILTNFFSDNIMKFSNRLVDGLAIHHIRDTYNIPPYLWKDAFHIVSDAISHYKNYANEFNLTEAKENFA